MPIAQSLLPWRTSEGFGFADPAGKLQLPARYEDVGPFSQGMAWAKQGGKVGFIDTTGAWKIAPQYDEAASFNDGVAPVRLGQHFGYVDLSGKPLIPLEYDPPYPFEEALLRFHEGHRVVQRGDERCIFNLQGQKTFCSSAFTLLDQRAQGLHVAKKRGAGYGYLTSEGVLKISTSFEFADRFQEGLAVVGRNSLFGVIDLSGNERVPFRFTSVQGGFSQGLLAVTTTRQSSARGKIPGHWGYINPQGQEIVPLSRYDEALPATSGGVIVQEEGLYWLVDSGGKRLSAGYHAWSASSEGLSVVARRSGERTLYGYVDAQGRERIPLQYQSASPFCHGVGRVLRSNQPFYLDVNGRELLSNP